VAKPAEGVEQPVRHQADVGGRAVVEVVPVQELVEDGLVEEGDDAEAEQQPGDQVAAGPASALGCAAHR
jgi:hypothetical protein